jgi:hypothetical protein
VRIEEVLQTVKDEWKIIQTLKRRKTNWLQLAKEFTSKTRCGRKDRRKDRRTGRRWERRKQLVDDLKEKRRKRKLKEKAPNRMLWRIRFGRDYWPFARQTTQWMNEWCYDLEDLHFKTESYKTWTYTNISQHIWLHSHYVKLAWSNVYLISN